MPGSANVCHPDGIVPSLSELKFAWNTVLDARAFGEKKNNEKIKEKDKSQNLLYIYSIF
jgi:hypothetical protein